ncbi:MAG: glucuronyl hydrolase [Flavobacterium sp.]|uniref:glycoside hydrolase family 88 protein n=1 Tax=Flavobacterium sp. TaxID=239 RepID=UPI00121FF8B8|nr:glycoside hydrolase family 88 protein [Flavobacterium sp.]RZJ63371.1 MAG: glucuronyl hydrolase [Flavobacterium sp.]
MNQRIFAALLILCAAFPTHSQNKEGKKLLSARYEKLLAFTPDSTKIPRSINLKTNTFRGHTSLDWVSGFFAGNLWEIYALKGDARYEAQAQKWTKFLEKEQFDRTSHDIGFKMMCSVGNAYKAKKTPEYKAVLIQSAKTLVKRFNPKVGSIRSWDFNQKIWEYPVIIDNMMNLELLFEATLLSGDKTYADIAIKHANTTLKNHFRPDGSAYHVVVYDSIKGKAKMKITHQGFADESVWSRGQAWGIYGYTMAFRYTKDKAYLDQAVKTAKFMMNHKNLPTDGIPYWDLSDKAIPNAARDASSAAIMASALYELYGFTNDRSFLMYAEKIMTSLQTTDYILPASENAPFILAHSTGNWPKKDEIDEPIVYADYYFLEALLRQKALKKGK